MVSVAVSELLSYLLVITKVLCSGLLILVYQNNAAIVGCSLSYAYLRESN
jgi:hypothetical protein